MWMRWGLGRGIGKGGWGEWGGGCGAMLEVHGQALWIPTLSPPSTGTHHSLLAGFDGSEAWIWMCWGCWWNEPFFLHIPSIEWRLRRGQSRVRIVG